jgi:hypothetical protein
MKKLLNFLSAWKNVRTVFNILYYFVFFFWFFVKTIMMAFSNYIVTTNDIFMAMTFIVFFLVDIYDAIKK